MKFAATYVYATLLTASALVIAQPLPPLIESRDAFSADTELSELAARDVEYAHVEARIIGAVVSLFSGIGKAIAGAVAKSKAKKAAKKAEAIRNGTYKEKPKKQPKQKKTKGGKRKRDLLDLETEFDEEFERSELEDLVARYFDLEEEFDEVSVRGEDEEFEEVSMRGYEETLLDDLE